MKQLAILIACTIFALAGSSARAQQTGGPGDAGIYTTTLNNGLRVVVVEDHAAPVVQTAMWYHFGSLDETKGKTGLAHATEHMMFRGTTDMSAGGLDDIVARLGAQMNGQTSYDYTQFYFMMPADKVDVGLAIEADRMQHAAMRQADWNIERNAVLNELEGDEGSPFFSLLQRVRAAAYPGQPNGRTPTGYITDVEHASAADIAKYYHEWYAPNNATLVVSGDVDHTVIFAKAQHYFGAIPRKTLPPRIEKHPTPVAHTVTVASDLPFPFGVVDLAYAVPGDTEPGEPAISTLAALIENQLSPFYAALVQSNIAIALQAEEDTQLKGGLLDVYIVLNPGHTAAEAERVFQTTMTQTLASGFSPDLVEAAKRLTIAERLYAADSVDGLGDLAGYTYGIVGERISDEDDRLAALDGQSLLAVARQYLSRPTVIGHLDPNAQPPRSNSQKSNAAITDDFSKRVPTGPIIEPPALREAARTPTTARSTLDPTSFTLSNGIRVLVQPKTDRTTFVLSGEIASSPAFAPAGQEGIGELASTLADYGSAQYPFAQRRKAIDMMGAVVQNGQNFSARGLSRDFSKIVAILADGEMHPAFSEPWFTLEREQLANSLQSTATISGVMIDRAYLRLLASPSDPSLRNATQASVDELTQADLTTFTKTYWRPDLTTIAVVGDVSADQVRSELESAFGAWTAQGPKPDAHAMAFPAAHAGHEYIGTDANQVYVRLGQPAVGRNSPDYDTLLVLNQILGAGGAFESRLWQELRQKRGLVYGVASAVDAGSDRGDFKIELNASPGKVVEAVALVRSELKMLQTQPVTQTELDDAKLRLVSDALLAESSADGQVSQLLDIGTNDLPLDYYRTLNERFADITAADVERVAKKYLDPTELVEIYSGPPGPWSRTY
ncbi:MAG TPA: pitrilysin family protein [Alphaproteobacteria bacterium]|nr:pitrilysin family protein [Alphaproteobacteria bacterium]